MTQLATPGQLEELAYHRERFSERDPETWVNRNYKQILDTYYAGADLDYGMFDGAVILDVGGGAATGLYHEPFDRAAIRISLDPLALDFQYLVRDDFAAYRDNRDVIQVIGFAEVMPFLDGFFDYIININSIDHWDNWKQGILETRRVIRLGGKMFLNVYLDHPHKTPGHPHGITRDGSIGWILRYGFSLLFENTVWITRPTGKRLKSFYSVMEAV